MLKLSTTEYSILDCDELLNAIDTADGIHLRVDGPIQPDCLRTCLVLAALARQRKTIRVEIQPRASTRSNVGALYRSLWGPLVWKGAEPTTCEFDASSIIGPTFETANKDIQYFATHTSRLRADDPNPFQADLVVHLERAGIVLPRTFLAALTTIGFEAQSNAEEYGYRSFDPDDNVDFRIIAAIIHEDNAGIAPLAQAYFQEYSRVGHSLTTRWLELLVVDAGVGIAYPRYAVLAAASKWENDDLYSMDQAAERTLLRLILEKGATTKAQWGRVINRHTAPGQGLRQIKARIASSRSCAIVRTGRSVANWYGPQLAIESLGAASIPAYEVSEASHALFKGTAWQFLLPLDPQFALAL